VNVLTALGETMPPTPDGLLKFNRDEPWRNTIHHEASGTDISAPPPAPDYSQWSPSEEMKREIHTVAKGIYGSMIDGFDFSIYRQCWDAVAPDGNFLISPHSHCQGLYIATGGSFHGWKFLPVIGKYVVQMLEGSLSKEHEKRWSWDRDYDVPNGRGYQPTREWKNV
jgi:sarcosine oxidase/L-pipecolate oxidase